MFLIIQILEKSMWIKMRLYQMCVTLKDKKVICLHEHEFLCTVFLYTLVCFPY